ncbi:MAG: hypothetical protein R3F56_24695 [Planctomycetota bacterium]
MHRSLVAVVVLASVNAQVRFEPHLDLAARANHAMAYDTVRQRVCLFGGGQSRDDLWEWDGAGWVLRSAFVGPIGRYGHAMAFDPVRGRLVVFGGQSSYGASLGDLDDTWEWDGTNWTQMTPQRHPSLRSGARAAYDSVRGRVILFGGIHITNGQGTFYDDLWEWDGTNWTALNPGFRPSPRSEAALAFDPARGRLVMYGGWGGSSVGLVDAWEWDGTTWTDRTSATGPRLDRGAAAVFSATAGGIVLLGQTNPSLQFPHMETWRYDGAAWTLVTGGPTDAGNFVVMAHDAGRARTVSYGAAGGETWEFDGALWVRAAPSAAPAFRYQSVPSMVFDTARGVTVLVGNSTSAAQVETWERQGNGWTRRVGVGGPSISIGQAMAYDSTRARTVLFGGLSPYGGDQTWEYDGAVWTQRTPSPRPPALYGHSMAFDPLRDRVVLFGATSTNAPGVTWEWDGATWTPHTPAHSPWGRRFAGMAWHPLMQRVLLYGGGEGQTTTSLFADIWAWDGTDWTRMSTSIPPGERTRHAMVYDFARDRLVVHGGRDTRDVRTDTWEWDLTTWTQRTPTTNPGPTSDLAMVFDHERRESVVFGGVTYRTWTYGPEVAALATPFGTGCNGTAGRPTLTAQTLPWLGDSFRQLASSLPAQSVAVLELGASRQIWHGFTLPLDLSSIGMLGCWKYVSTDVTVPFGTQGGAVTQAMPVPAAASLHGARLFTQVFCVDPGANPFGATMSNALDVTLGGR